jgi:hypothetical protein
MASSSYKCMVVIPKTEYDSMKNAVEKSMSNVVGEAAKDNSVTNVTNEGGLVLVANPNSGGRAHERSSEDNERTHEKPSFKSEGKKDFALRGSTDKTSSRGQYQTGRFAKLKGKAAAVLKNPRTHEEELKKAEEQRNPDVDEKQLEKKVVLNDMGRPIVKGRRLLPPSLKRRRGEEEGEEVLERKRQREDFLQQNVDEKLAKLQGQMPPSPFTRGSLTSRPIARVLQAPIFKPEKLQAMDVDDEESVHQAETEPLRQMNRVEEHELPMEEDDFIDEQSYPLVPYKRGQKRVNLIDDVEEKPVEKRRWLGERAHTDGVVSYPDDEDEADENSTKAINFTKKQALTYDKRGQKRLNYDDKDAIAFPDRKRIKFEQVLDAERRKRAFKRKALTYEGNEVKKPNISRKRRREEDGIGNEKKKPRRKAEKRPYPHGDKENPIPTRRRRYMNDSEYDIW